MRPAIAPGNSRSRHPPVARQPIASKSLTENWPRPIIGRLGIDRMRETFIQSTLSTIEIAKDRGDVIALETTEREVARVGELWW